MNDEPASQDLIRYDVLTQTALRGVIRKVLEEVAAAGLPGEHHFFITFDTTVTGVRLSKRMRERYPESMTIVIQHTYWDLNVSDTGFEVDLTFNDIRERLAIPYAAIQAFFDPSVKFGLQFDVPEDDDQAMEIDEEQTGPDHQIDTLPASKKPDPDPEDKDPSQAASQEQAGEVVSLDAFRKNK